MTMLEIVKFERNYQLLLDKDSPLGEVFDVLSEMRFFVFQRMQEAMKEENSKKEAQDVIS